ncbi:MAG: hypothetical protein H0W96_04585 [Solirubrobacterales bacterium]|nr:hypothetical protein [Solirubrobacterales bacterium]
MTRPTIAPDPPPAPWPAADEAVAIDGAADRTPLHRSLRTDAAGVVTRADDGALLAARRRLAAFDAFGAVELANTACPRSRATPAVAPFVRARRAAWLLTPGAGAGAVRRAGDFSVALPAAELGDFADTAPLVDAVAVASAGAVAG